MPRKVESLADIRAELARLDPSRIRVEGPWSVAQVLSHCAQSMEYSLIGFPLDKPRWFQATIGKVVLGKFLRQGYMQHDIAGAIPGAPPPADMEPHKALARLIASIDKFEAHGGPFAPHFAYGEVDKERYGRVQAMHIAQHLESFRQAPAATKGKAS
jgi:hypothetical protein